MKFLGIEVSKSVLIGILVGVVAIGGVIMSVILMNNNKDDQKQEEKQKNTILLKDDLKFEINSKVNILDIISEDNKVKVLSENEAIDTSILGEKEVTIKYEVEEKEEEKTFKITIVDTQAPNIEYKKELSTNVGTKINLLKDVKVSDNSKEEIKATIEGDYNFDNEGTYNLKYVAVDSSNNKAEEEFTLKVNKPTCNKKSGSWSTSKPSSLCEYKTKKITWRWQMIMDEAGNERWAWTVDFIFKGVGAGSAEPKDITSKDYDVYPYLSTKPNTTYSDNQEHEKTITVYIIK